MTFLNPLLLFGLIAAAIPIILHLLNLRKLKTIEFSTLQFLKELQKTKMRKVKIRQWLLLALRTLIIIAVVMAFSRPALKGSLAGFPLGGSTHARTTMVLLLDDSPSMNVRNERGTFFSQALEAANSIAGLMKDGDAAFLVRLSDIRHQDSFTPALSAGVLQDALKQLQPSQESVSYRDALGTAAKILADSKNFNHEVYLITDAQASQFTGAEDATDSTDLFGDNVRIFLVDVRSGSTNAVENAGVTSVEVASSIITINKPVQLKASVTNAGTTALRGAVQSVYLDGARVMQHSADLAASNSLPLTLSIIPKRAGINTGYLQIEDDAFESDNRRYFAFNVPARIRVLAVGNLAGDTQLPTLALSLDQDTAAAGLFAVDQILENKLSSSDLSKYDILMLAGVKQFSSGDAERIADFVQTGGGVMMFAGRASDVANYNAVLFPKLGIPSAGPAQSFSGAASYPPQERGSFLSFGKVDFDHPLFAGMFEQRIQKQQTSIESPKVYMAIAPQPGVRGRSVITLSDGQSFLVDYQHGAGRLLLFSVEAGLTWSDFPLKGIFVPLMYRSGLYLAQTQSIPSFTTGDELKVSLRLRERTGKDAYVLRSPSGVDERVLPQIAPGTGLATFTSRNSSEAGLYELHKLGSGTKDELLHIIPVNIPSYETDLTHASADETAALFARLGATPEQIRELAVSGQIDTAVMQSRFGVELWKYFVVLALLFALAEMIIGREAKSERLS